ncbi:MAG: hypothetical protein V1733_03045 [bacterium]
MKYLILSNVILICSLAGCTSIKPRNLGPVPPPPSASYQLPTANCRLPTFFTDPSFQKALFKASMDIRDYHLTGLVFMKKILDTRYGIRDTGYGMRDLGSCVYRVVFSNELGMTFFDFEISADSMQVIYCFEPMNKKPMLKILGTNFRLLLGTHMTEEPCLWFFQRETGNLVGKDKSDHFKRWSTFSPAGDTLYSVACKSTFADATRISFTQYNLGFPGKIRIENPFVKLKLSLTLLSLN